MSTIAILKQIVDLLYEESKFNDINTLKIKLKNLEREIQEKNTEISQLCTENIKMENMLKKYENDFDLLTSMTGNTHTKTETEDTKNTETKVNEPTPQPTQPTQQTQQQTDHVAPKDRKDYMKEYQRNYRKKKKEEKQMSMNV